MHNDIEEIDLESYGSVTTFGEAVKGSKDDYTPDKSDDDEIDLEIKRTSDITQERLREVHQELCLIKLCWPEIDIRKDIYLRTLPSSYCTLDGKERLLAWYAENFRRQFHARFPDRKPLLLMCENECRIQKFVSTTIRRSTLPYPELYTWQGCAKFVSDYIEYEPLDKALSMPTQLRSPTWMLKFQKGHCFEYATLLVSLLLGQGYNAYVVSGYATVEQTFCDQSRRSCPYLPKPPKPPPPPKVIDTPKYQLLPPPNFQSEFQVELKTEEEKKIEEEIQLYDEEEQRIIEELERPPEDDCHKYRVHAWVVILPDQWGGLRGQEVSKPLFIEPSSGLSFAADDDETSQLYFRVESVWNDLNYWVNVQSSKGQADMVWDLSKVEFWEHLLPGEPWTMRGVVSEIDDEITILQEKHLDMPVSYVDEIVITDAEFERRYPNGKKTIFYKKTKAELFAPYIQLDGLVERITLYDDYDYIYPIEVFEKYANRSDNLIESRRNLCNDSVVDYYKRGRSDQCKEHRYFASSNDSVESERIIEFYDVARLDGLARIEMHPTYLTQNFIDRDDFLYYRHVEFNLQKSVPLPNDIHYRQISTIIEKYHQDKRIPTYKNIAVREFAVEDNEIRLMFHYKPEQCSRATRSYVKPPLAERGDRLVLNPLMMQVYYPSPTDEPEKLLDLYYELDTQLKEEDHSMSQVRAAEVEVSLFLKTRSSEYIAPELLISPFNKHRDVTSQLELAVLEEKKHAHSQRDVTDEVDYLRPYLARIGHPPDITKMEARSLQEQCLDDYKELLVRRANNMLRQFEEGTQELVKLQTLLTQSEDLRREEEEHILQRTTEINFNLHTLEIRLNRHRDLVPGRYKMLLEHLREHSYLSAIHK